MVVITLHGSLRADQQPQGSPQAAVYTLSQSPAEMTASFH